MYPAGHQVQIVIPFSCDSASSFLLPNRTGNFHDGKVTMVVHPFSMKQARKKATRACLRFSTCKRVSACFRYNE